MRETAARVKWHIERFAASMLYQFGRLFSSNGNVVQRLRHQITVTTVSPSIQVAHCRVRSNADVTLYAACSLSENETYNQQGSIRGTPFDARSTCGFMHYACDHRANWFFWKCWISSKTLERCIILLDIQEFSVFIHECSFAFNTDPRFVVMQNTWCLLRHGR